MNVLRERTVLVPDTWFDPTITWADLWMGSPVAARSRSTRRRVKCRQAQESWLT
jgi:hypothetical protein